LQVLQIHQEGWLWEDTFVCYFVFSLHLNAQFMKSLVFNPIFLLGGLSLCLLACISSPGSPERAPLPIPPDTRQLLLVESPHWDSISGLLHRYERVGSSWQKAGEAIPITVGKNGMAWGRGLEGFPSQDGKQKQEGDGRSPAGLFRLSTAFGYASPDTLPPLHFPYLQIDEQVQCIEDTSSRFYNRIVGGNEETDWVQTDYMLREDDLYRWGVFVNHNADPVLPGGGSCIFLHAWRGPGRPTAGCTAMPLQDIRQLVFWLKAEAKPLLLQLPASEYAGFRKFE
jgi:D-alanyl-D-alanine dipeptidase